MAENAPEITAKEAQDVLRKQADENRQLAEQEIAQILQKRDCVQVPQLVIIGGRVVRHDVAILNK